MSFDFNTDQKTFRFIQRTLNCMDTLETVQEELAKIRKMIKPGTNNIVGIEIKDELEEVEIEVLQACGKLGYLLEKHFSYEQPEKEE